MFFFFSPSRDKILAWRKAKKVKSLRRAVSFATLEGRALAARYLGELSDREAIPVLSSALQKDAVPAVRLAAAQALSCLGDLAIPSLSLALRKDVEQSVRKEAAKALGTIGNQDARSALEDALLGDPKGDVRAAAARALGQIHSIESIGVLRASLFAGHPLLTEGAAEALLQLSQGANFLEKERAAFLVGLQRFSEAIEVDNYSIDLFLLRAAISRDGSALPAGLLEAICQANSPKSIPFLSHRLAKIRRVLSGAPSSEMHRFLLTEKDLIENALGSLQTEESLAEVTQEMPVEFD